MKRQRPQFIEDLAQELSNPLPGRDAQHRMAPQPRSKPWKGSYDKPSEDARQGGVLILLYPDEGEFYLPLILRPTYKGVHSGQIALPGGAAEQEDGDLSQTALRETYEEVGVPSNQIQILGQLSPLYVFASNFLVQPVVGWTESQPDFQTDPHEVAQLIKTPLGALQNPENYHCETWELRDRTALVPHYRIQTHNVWGATAMMLSEFLTLNAVREISPFPYD